MKQDLNYNKILSEKVKTEYFEFKATFNQDVKINSDDLNSEFEKQPELYSKYAFLYEMMNAKLQRSKYLLDILYAQLDHKKRSDAAAAKLTKYTEKMCENEVITDPSYQKLKKEVLDLEESCGILKAARDAISLRKDMLISLGANARAQKDNFGPISAEQQEFLKWENRLKKQVTDTEE